MHKEFMFVCGFTFVFDYGGGLRDLRLVLNCFVV